ncbi:MAG: hypothetical protein AVDCRST_MAG73-1710 [uncultured Thermomicrobiales bacterium]|uniref:Uncharacterized protein n=1 Tax=uncultured Thermomicrobiales bacterium TaxID=1645740 RepID=A0A6J4U2I5_9BACT|nr:MAG: hypothetical protein AVDCRST_MAG73-1710 [uncultured Thermomicrobiales bacterium]
MASCQLDDNRSSVAGGGLARAKIPVKPSPVRSTVADRVAPILALAGRSSPPGEGPMALFALAHHRQDVPPSEWAHSIATVVVTAPRGRR